MASVSGAQLPLQPEAAAPAAFVPGTASAPVHTALTPAGFIARRVLTAGHWAVLDRPRTVL